MKDYKTPEAAFKNGVPMIKHFHRIPDEHRMGLGRLQAAGSFGTVPRHQVMKKRSKNEQLVMEELRRRGGEPEYYKGGKPKSKKSMGSYQACYHTHPPLTFKDKVTGVEVSIFGGSCLSPKVKDADIYVGLDSGMKFTPRNFPWEPGAEIRFPVIDHSHPKPEEMSQWRNLMDYLMKELRAGAKVHIGCIGGHGRTGLLLSCLVKEMAGIEDSTTYVREHYCKKVVESKTQVEWLHGNFGIKKVEPAKKYGGMAAGTADDYMNMKRTSGGGSSYRSDTVVGFSQESPNNVWESLDKHDADL